MWSSLVRDFLDIVERQTTGMTGRGTSAAPTGAGKTVLFELAIVKVFEEALDSRVIYMSPTKALCTERARDWKQKFQGIGLTCALYSCFTPISSILQRIAGEL
jgi:superfamily II DNA or RNA helicase